MQQGSDTIRRIHCEPAIALSEEIFQVSKAIGLSRDAQEVLAELIAESPESISFETFEKWGEGIKKEVIRCLIQTSAMIRQRMHRIESLDMLEKICQFLHKITGEDIYMFLTSMYRDREDHPSRINANAETDIADQIRSRVTHIGPEPQFAQAA